MLRDERSRLGARGQRKRRVRSPDHRAK
jgi:hypothetical protein